MVDFILSYVLVNLKRIYAGVVTIALIFFAYKALNTEKIEVCTQTIFVNDGQVSFIQCDVFAESQRPVVMELSRKIAESVWSYSKGDDVSYAVGYSNILKFVDGNSQAGNWMRSEFRKNAAGDNPAVKKESSSVTIETDSFRTKDKDKEKWLVTFLAKRDIAQLAGTITQEYIVNITFEQGDNNAIYKAVNISSDAIDSN
jgi:hypothetical protein